MLQSQLHEVNSTQENHQALKAISTQQIFKSYTKGQRDYTTNFLIEELIHNGYFHYNSHGDLTEWMRALCRYMVWGYGVRQPVLVMDMEGGWGVVGVEVEVGDLGKVDFSGFVGNGNCAKIVTIGLRYDVGVRVEVGQVYRLVWEGGVYRYGEGEFWLKGFVVNVDESYGGVTKRKDEKWGLTTPTHYQILETWLDLCTFLERMHAKPIVLFYQFYPCFNLNPHPPPHPNPLPLPYPHSTHKNNSSTHKFST